MFASGIEGSHWNLRGIRRKWHLNQNFKGRQGCYQSRQVEASRVGDNMPRIREESTRCLGEMASILIQLCCGSQAFYVSSPLRMLKFGGEHKNVQNRKRLGNNAKTITTVVCYLNAQKHHHYGMISCSPWFCVQNRRFVDLTMVSCSIRTMFWKAR